MKYNEKLLTKWNRKQDIKNTGLDFSLGPRDVKLGFDKYKLNKKKSVNKNLYTFFIEMVHIGNLYRK